MRIYTESQNIRFVFLLYISVAPTELKKCSSCNYISSSHHNISPPRNGETYCFSSIVCLSVCPSVCTSCFRVRSISFKLLVGFTNNFAQMSRRLVWLDDVQCLCLTKVGSRSRSQSKIKQFTRVFRVCSISFEPLVGFTNNFAQKYDETIYIAYVWPRSVQGQGHNIRLNIVWLHFVSALYLLNPWWDLQITLHKSMMRRCVVPMFDKGRFKVKVTIYD